MPLVHQELHRIACRCMAGERPEHTLQATALVNEAFVRLVGADVVSWQDWAHFLAVSAQVMRRILVDHARARGAQKRGGPGGKVTFDETFIVTTESREDLVALDDALAALAESDERKSRVIELRYFGGLSVAETAAVLDVSPETVMRDWQMARAWLRREMRAHEK